VRRSSDARTRSNFTVVTAACQQGEQNHDMLTESEMCVLEDFRLHCEALEYNHLSGDKTADAPLFPIKMNEILG
jgi:hypothetical protein